MPEQRPGPEREVRYAWAAEIAAGRRVLDAGCGAGWGTALLARGAAEAVGVDFSPPAILAARELRGERARFLVGDLRDLPLEDAEFDCAVCFEALTHLAEPEGALDELRRVLRPGGVLCVSAPNPAVYPAGNPLQLSEVPPAELARLLRERFANVAVHPQQAYSASLLGDPDLLARMDPLQAGEVRATKLAGGSTGEELYAVAVASDGALPPAPARLALGAETSEDGRWDELREWQERAVRAEAEACALRRKLRESQS